MAGPRKSGRLSDGAQAGIATGIFALVGIVLTQWKEMPWNLRADAPPAATASQNSAAPVQANAVPVTGRDAGTPVSDISVKTDAKPAEAQPQGHWIVPARFTINQQGCREPVEVIGAWDNGVDLSNGAAVSHCGDGPAVRGSATGTLRGSHFKLTIEWDSTDKGSVGIYEGTVDAEGHVNGFSHAPGHTDWGKPSWRGDVALSRAR